jgi:hypothetical protein
MAARPKRTSTTGYFSGDDPVGAETCDLSDPTTRQRIGEFEDHMKVARCDSEQTVDTPPRDGRRAAHGRSRRRRAGLLDVRPSRW